MKENIENRYELTPDRESKFNNFKKFLHAPIKKESNYKNILLFRAFCQIFYDNVRITKDPDQSWVEVYEAIGTLIRKRDIKDKKIRKVIRETVNNLSIYNKLKRGKWKKLFERRPGKGALYRPRFIKILNPKNRKDLINGLDANRERAENKYTTLINIVSKKLEPKEEILHLTHIAEPSGLVIPKTEQKLRSCFYTLMDTSHEIIPREDAKFLADLFKKKDLQIVVEGFPMEGKSTFAYLVAKEWIGNVGIVRWLEAADLEFIKNENFLVMVDIGAYIPFDLDMFSKLQDAKKLLIVRRLGEPEEHAKRKAREAIDNTFTLDEGFLERKSKELKYFRFRCEIGKMDNVLGVISSLEKESKIKVSDEVKKEIAEICLTTDRKHTVLGLIKAIFMGLNSLYSEGKISSYVKIDEFMSIGASKLKKEKASDKILEHIFTWLDSDVQNLLYAFKFYQEILGISNFLNELVLEEAYKIYNKTELQNITIKKGIDIKLIDKGNYEVVPFTFTLPFITEGGGTLDYIHLLKPEEYHEIVNSIFIIPHQLIEDDKKFYDDYYAWHCSRSFYKIWHPWQLEIIELSIKRNIEEFVDSLVKRLEKEQNIATIIMTLRDIRLTNRHIAWQVARKLSIDNILNKLLNERRTFWTIKGLNMFLLFCNGNEYTKIVKELIPERLRLLENTENPLEILRCLPLRPCGDIELRQMVKHIQYKLILDNKIPYYLVDEFLGDVSDFYTFWDIYLHLADKEPSGWLEPKSLEEKLHRFKIELEDSRYSNYKVLIRVEGYLYQKKGYYHPMEKCYYHPIELPHIKEHISFKIAPAINPENKEKSFAFFKLKDKYFLIELKMQTPEIFFKFMLDPWSLTSEERISLYEKMPYIFQIIQTTDIAYL